MWQELKRISALTETEIGGTIDKDSRIKGFSIEGIGVEYSGKFYGFSKGEFGKRPRDVATDIFNI